MNSHDATESLRQASDAADVTEAPAARGGVLFVDLDSTLVATDLLWEAVVLALKRRPWLVFLMVLHAARGRARFKAFLAERVAPEAASLPYREEVMELLRRERDRGNSLVLASATNERWARMVAQQVGLFDDVVASTKDENRKGRLKLAAMEAYCRQHGFDQFAYVGDSTADIPIWKQAARVFAVTPSAKTVRLLNGFCEPIVLRRRDSRAVALLRALRPQQWSKNLLLFVPLVMAHDILVFEKLSLAIVAFVVFSACASVVYLLNDLLDLEADRRHPVKRHRPFAAGTLPVSYGPALISGLLGIGILLALLTLPAGFVGILAAYLSITLMYSFWLKRKVIVDVMVLSGLYTIRIVAGGAASATWVSEWLIAFSVFLFTSLAFVKRYAEVTRLADEGNSQAEGRGYLVSDRSLLQSMGSASGYLAVLVLALYINSAAVTELYVNMWALWLICPLLLYWISRIWFKANRRELSEDPVVFALRDPTSLLVGGLTALLLIVATAPW